MIRRPPRSTLFPSPTLSRPPAWEGWPAQPGLLQRGEPLYRRKRHRRREALSVALRGDAPLFQVQFTDLAGLGERLSETLPLHGQLGLHGFIEQFNAHGARIVPTFAATMQCARVSLWCLLA